ncbi:hypothetical protein F5H01DRAFT_377352 [Linnemannia elongata]|nr:hypothetical protein F5H01DRAFT_377352 [Linnemannia elongata]
MASPCFTLPLPTHMPSAMRSQTLVPTAIGSALSKTSGVRWQPKTPTYKSRFSRSRDTPLDGGNYCSSCAGRVCRFANVQSVFVSGPHLDLSVSKTETEM